MLVYLRWLTVRLPVGPTVIVGYDYSQWFVSWNAGVSGYSRTGAHDQSKHGVLQNKLCTAYIKVITPGDRTRDVSHASLLSHSPSSRLSRARPHKRHVFLTICRSSVLLNNARRVSHKYWVPSSICESSPEAHHHQPHTITLGVS